MNLVIFQQKLTLTFLSYIKLFLEILIFEENLLNEFTYILKSAVSQNNDFSPKRYRLQALFECIHFAQLVIPVLLVVKQGFLRVCMLCFHAVAHALH